MLSRKADLLGKIQVNQELEMIEFSASWLEAFRYSRYKGDFDKRAEIGKHPDDFEWWKNHQNEIRFFFNTLQELDLGYFAFGEKEDVIVFCARKAFKRYLLKGWKPLVMDIATFIDTE